MKKVLLLTIPALLLVLGLTVSCPGPASAALTVDANHNHIKVGYNYHGSDVGLKGISDPGVDLVLTVSSEDSHQKLKEKTKVGGVIWMNTGDVILEHVPNVYYLRSTRAPEEILTAEELLADGIGYQAILERAEIESTNDDITRKESFDEFVKYKEANRLYSIMDGGVELAEQDGGRKYSTVIDWPYQIPPGQYHVTARAVREGKVVERVTTEVTVERAGIVKELANMAQNNGALYGVLAIVIALMAGFGVGLIFRTGGGAH